MKQKKGKYYAILYPLSEKRAIVCSWEVCQLLIKGQPQLFHSFDTFQDAVDWFDTITEADKQRALRY